jgi:hypothetical protein
MTGTLTEKQVVNIWQEFLPGQTDLATEEGGTVRIIYPGRPNDDRGADWRDAVIATAGGIRRGDIEIHVRSSHWWGHRHHQDPLYNRVVLHVVYRHDAAGAAVLENGRQVPTLALDKYVGDRDAGYSGRGSRPSPRSVPCRVGLSGGDTSFIGNILDEVGGRRFDAWVAEFRTELPSVGTGQSLYRGIMGALGYSKNKVPMIELAQRMPLEKLAVSFPAEEPDDYLARCQGLLMGMAGLLPSQREGCRRDNHRADGWVGRLEKAWEAYGGTAAMSAGDWNFFKIRPGNFLTRRIAAMSYLLLRYRNKYLLSGLIHKVAQVSPDDDCCRLERLLLVAAEGYWGYNLDFGLPGSRSLPALLGTNRAGVIVVNVILPFFIAWGRLNDRPTLAEKALEIFRHYNVLPENTLERHMRRQLGLGRYTVNSARRQQGLIHIYKTLCSQGKCEECPLNL